MGGDRAVHKSFGRIQEIASPRYLIPLVFEDVEIRYRRAPVCTGGRGHRSTWVMWRDFQPFQRRKRGNIAAFQDASTVLDVRHDDLDRLRSTKRREPFHAE